MVTLAYYALVHSAPKAYGSSFVCQFVGASVRQIPYLHER